MTNSPTDIPMLDDEAIAEIEALSAKVPDGPWFASADDAEDVPDHRRSGLALVDTGRSADWWIARLCEWHIARFIAESKTNVDALCATVRALRQRLAAMREKFNTSSTERERDLETQLEQAATARDQLSAALSVRDAQLKQATKERDDLWSSCDPAVDALRERAIALCRDKRLTWSDILTRSIPILTMMITAARFDHNWPLSTKSVKQWSNSNDTRTETTS